MTELVSYTAFRRSESPAGLQNNISPLLSASDFAGEGIRLDSSCAKGGEGEAIPIFHRNFTKGPAILGSGTSRTTKAIHRRPLNSQVLTELSFDGAYFILQICDAGWRHTPGTSGP
jgi:hypothetical protein